MHHFKFLVKFKLPFALLLVSMLMSWQPADKNEVKTFARFVPERADDFAWENDKVAFRVYGPAMRKRPENSGIDCWLKRVDYAIIDKWYLGNVNKKSYHRDHGEGYDPYHVGSSRGCGGLGLWINDSLILSNTYKEWKVIKSTVEETSFVLTYEWYYDGNAYKEEKQISIKLGDRYFKAVSTFWKNGKIAAALPIAVGITTHDGKGSVSKDIKAGWMSCWETIDGFGLGTGLVIDPARIKGFKVFNTKQKDDGHALYITSTDNEGKVEYIAGYGWEKAGEIRTSADWNDYLKSQTNVFELNEIVRRMEKAADWQIYNPAPNEDLEWHSAPFYMGLTDLYEVSKEEKYLEYLRLIGEKHNWKIRERKYHADDHAVGLAYIKLYEHYKNPKMIAAINKEFDWILANPPAHSITENGITRLRYNRERWNWCDALYMAPPVWAGLGAVKGNDSYFDYLVQEWKQAHEWYWCEEESLYFHDKRDIVKISPAGKKVFWARGDGWVIAGLVEVLQYLPENHPERGYFETVFKSMAAKLLSIQKDNGTWAPSLLDPENPPQDDISGSVFYVYGLAWGINNGLLDAEQYETCVRRGWKALCERQKTNGRLINIQPVGGYPKAFDPETTAIFGVGGFISAGSEIWKLIQGKKVTSTQVKTQKVKKTKFAGGVNPAKLQVNTTPEPDLQQKGMKALFNGKNLSGWTVKGGSMPFEVVNGEIIGTCDPDVRLNSFLCTKKKYSDFIFTVEYKWDELSNSGVMFRADTRALKDGERMAVKDRSLLQVFGYQCEVETSDRSWTGGIYGEAMGGWKYPLSKEQAHKSARAAVKNHKDWNRVTIYAKGDHIMTWINGVPCSTIKNKERSEGFFGLQVHQGKKGQIRWKNIRLKDLSR